MPPAKRPLAVTVVAILYIAVGIVGSIGHGHEFLTRGGSRSEIFWIELTELLALLFGIFLLRGRNWARWGALAWMAFHVVLSVTEAYRGFAVHLVLLALFAWLLFRPSSSSFFRPVSQPPAPPT
ncbi:MAG TPA: hypothetical protein VL128_10700 [Candidatus Eisenbacteria bacterium]|nr:hypothetical protein [Candidatus Eisenbacteria bacterium]